VNIVGEQSRKVRMLLHMIGMDQYIKENKDIVPNVKKWNI
jgi:hypothetical protein